MSIKQRSKYQPLLELMIVTRLRGLCWYIHNSHGSVLWYPQPSGLPYTSLMNKIPHCKAAFLPCFAVWVLSPDLVLLRQAAVYYSPGRCLLQLPEQVSPWIQVFSLIQEVRSLLSSLHIQRMRRIFNFSFPLSAKSGNSSFFISPLCPLAGDCLFFCAAVWGTLFLSACS